MSRVNEIWDTSEEGRCPSTSDKSLAQIMRGLIACQGRLLDSCVHGKSVAYRISLPPGFNTRFEEVSGYTLTRPEMVSGQ